MTQYLLSVWHAEDAEVYPDDETMQRAFTQVDAFNEELKHPDPGCSQAGSNRLRPPASCGSPTRGRRSPTAHSPRQTSTSVGFGSSKPPTWTQRTFGHARRPKPA